jgi:hypothetical protein
MKGEKGLQGCVAVATRRKKVTEKLLLVELGQAGESEKEPSGSRSFSESRISRLSISLGQVRY